MAEPVWLVSIHDVMPGTLSRVQRIAANLDERGIAPLTLLVVPGLPWRDAELAWLRARQTRGDRLAGHGWVHRAAPPRGLYDRLHRRFFSRGVAEHLPLSGTDIARMIRRCFDWFGANALAEPQLYVPPAWAMGGISRTALRELPFELYETLGGVYRSGDDRFRRVPLLGFEADTRCRALSLRVSNRLNQSLARLNGRLRVSIHPDDPDLLLAADLAALLARPGRCAAYA